MIFAQSKMCKMLVSQLCRGGSSSWAPYIASLHPLQLQLWLSGNENEPSDVHEAVKGFFPMQERRRLTCACTCAQVYWWNEKYRPRKPKYFNRVHTGYEWNKYNQTHYDHDNPPPKVVQGYKFNIFYPDLIDKAEAPTYTLDKVMS